MTLGGNPWRTIAGIAVLAVLAAAAVLLTPPYIENWKLQQYLNDLESDASIAQKPPAVIQADVVNKASELGLPVHSEDVRVTRSGDGVRIEVLYVVHIDMALYTVDLHFRPAG